MMKIGDFSQLTGVPVKTLRYYAEIGLLHPACIEDNNYRYYGLEQLLEINHIIELKDCGFTLNEITNKDINTMNTSDLLCLYQKKLSVAEKERHFANMKIANLKRRISELKEKEKENMILYNLHQAPDHSTLMGTIKGVADFYSLNLSPEMLYGLTGQAFMINIHEELCPSGPYCYNLTAFIELLKNVGIEMKNCGFFTKSSTTKEREQIEKTIKEHLDSNNPCALLNMEYQLITGYDDTGFITTQPWSTDFPPGHLTYGTWEEIGNEIHMSIFTFNSVQQKPIDEMIKVALYSALEINTNPDQYTTKPYFTGLEAYDVFIKAIEDGHGSGQGNRWNATVWGECRNMASTFFKQLSDVYPNLSNDFLSLSHDYKLIGESLLKISESNLPIVPRIDVLKEIKSIESVAIDKIKTVLNKL
ncbi:MerR family transcriptional regulator [Vallitalea pronyensis]|uniref:MerR family transcriptional regulator n=1 Tax=Vallitalea pronyensis TaxID=1348613 RepID=A0A8J8MMX3_9FIRM|nr:MerR family transcriptional regulator [Vallitalea pronyensis]QUI24188.1 MerR family transcriptional regulator [Vallitalea pronyensis]